MKRDYRVSLLRASYNVKSMKVLWYRCFNDQREKERERERQENVQVVNDAFLVITFSLFVLNETSKVLKWDVHQK